MVSLTKGEAYFKDIFYIPPHTGLMGIQKVIKENKLEPFPYAFTMYVVMTGKRKKLQCGEYIKQTSFLKTVDALVNGRKILRKFTAPEGLTVMQIVDLLRKEPLLKGEVNVIPQEGMLFPATYYFERDQDRQTIIDRMHSEMQKRLSLIWSKREDGLVLETQYDVVKLASIVEKETNLDCERPHVASVFINRLKNSMALAADPTIVYETKTTPVRHSDLKKPSPYNTYLTKGLPPTPICCPGQSSLEAVIKDAKKDHLYFVATGTGGHSFSKTFSEHRRNIEKWKKVIKKS